MVAATAAITADRVNRKWVLHLQVNINPIIATPQKIQFFSP
jgi:hypothetical protein